MSIRSAAIALASVAVLAVPGTAFAADGPELVSVDSAGNPLPGTAAWAPEVSDDGNVVAFALGTSYQDSTGHWKSVKTVYVRDRAAQTTKKIFEGTAASDGNAIRFLLSGNGRYLVRYQMIGGAPDDYIKYDLSTGTSTRFTGPNYYLSNLSLSDDGTKLAATRGLGGSTTPRVYVINTDTGTWQTVATGVDYGSLSLSGDGAVVTYGQSDVYGNWGYKYRLYRQRLGNTRKRIDVRADGTVSADGNEHAFVRGISDGGRYVLFEEESGNGIAPDCDPATGDTDFPDRCLFRRDTVNHTTTLVSRDAAGNVEKASDFQDASISDGGTSVAFTANAGSNASGQLQIRNASTGTTRTIGRNAAGELPDVGPADYALAGNGLTAVVASGATNYGGPANTRSVYALPTR